MEPPHIETTIKPSEYHSVNIATNAFTDFVGGQSSMMHGSMMNGGYLGGKRNGPLSQYAQNTGAVCSGLNELPVFVCMCSSPVSACGEVFEFCSPKNLCI